MSYSQHNRHYSSREHAEFRAQLEADREAQTRAWERDKRVRETPKKSDGIPVRWYPDRGPRVGGVRLNGMIYAGHNPSDMVSPHIAEPSLVDPKYEVQFPEPGERVPALLTFPCYAYMSAMQRGRYLQFIASEKTSRDAEDIGYAFLYLYGLERRLIVDSKRPGEVSDDERRDVTYEVMRLIGEFKGRSRSFYQYATALLLYDGWLFEGHAESKQIKALFFDNAVSKRLEFKGMSNEHNENEGADAYEYMLLSRLSQSGIKFPEDDLLTYSVMRMSMSNMTRIPMSQLSNDSVRTRFMRLFRRRYRHSSVFQQDGYPTSSSTHKVHRPQLPPHYVPSNPSIRRHYDETNVSRRLFDIEKLDVPFDTLSDIAVSAYNDLVEYDSVLDNKSLRGLDGIGPDTILVSSIPTKLHDAVSGKKFAIIPPDVMIGEYSSAFGASPQTNAKGVLTSQAQLGYAALLSSIGWQPIMPGTFKSDALSSSWKITIDMPIIASERTTIYSKSLGKQSFVPLFGSSLLSSIPLDDDISHGLALAWFYGWFLHEIGHDADELELLKFPKSLIPKAFRKTSALLLFFAYACAELTYGGTSYAFGKCIDTSKFSDIQTIMFSVVQRLYGVVIPENVLRVMERVYTKKEVDKSMVLYDYRAGENRKNYEDDGSYEFSLDNDKLARTIDETSSVQSMLSDAIDDTEYAQGDVDMSDIDSGETLNDDSPDEAFEQNNGPSQDDVERIRSLFGGEDELDTKKLQQLIMSEFGLPTPTSAMSKLADVNTWYSGSHGDELVDVDGSDSYLN